MNWASKIADRTLGHNPISTGVTQPLTSATETMHAIVWRGKKDMRYEVVPKPMISEPDDVLVKVTATTVCGSDLHLYTGDLPGMESGDIVGHEAMGVIVAKGSNVKLELGTRVVISAIIACGKCDFCKSHEYSCCDTTNPSRVMENMFGHAMSGVFGYGHLLGGYWGCQAEFVRVPFGDVNCLPVPDDVPDEHALYLSDVLCTSFHACELGRVKKGDKVGVWGLGPIGLVTARWCQILGCDLVIGIDSDPKRLEVASHMGIRTINYKDQDVLAIIAQLAGPIGLDVAIEAAGFRFAKSFLHKIERALMLETDTPEIITECCKAVRKNGHVSVIGDYGGFCNNFPIGIIQMKHLHLSSGQVNLQNIWKRCLEYVRSGEMNPSFLITHRLTLAEIPEGYKKFVNHEDGMIKMFVRP